MGAVAGAEPALEVAGAGDGHTAQVRAHTNDDQVLHGRDMAGHVVWKVLDREQHCCPLGMTCPVV